MNKDLKNLKKPMMIPQQTAYLSEKTKLPKKEVANLLNTLKNIIAYHLKKLEEVSLMGLMKIILIKKQATKARKGISLFTKEPIVFKAKLAKKVVKVRALKNQTWFSQKINSYYHEI